MSMPLVEQVMSNEEFLLFRDTIHDHCGIYFDDESKYLLEKRIVSRITERGLSSYREYYNFLRFNRKKEQEMLDLLDVLTTNETYFFREMHQLKAFTDEIIPELAEIRKKNGNRVLRIWSAGCSSGEEPYTIAMLLNEIPEMRRWKIEIIGTDISQRVLQLARLAVYGSSAFRATDEYFRKKYFIDHGGKYRICDSMREMVTISHLNLLDTRRIEMLGQMDMIFCRNVIIYFDQTAKKITVEAFHSSLHDGGFLLLGHSESLMNITTLYKLRHFKNDMIYQKPHAALLSGGA